MMRDEKLVRVALQSKHPIERVLWVWGAILESAAEINDDGRFDFNAAEAAHFLHADEADILAIETSLANCGRIAEGCVVKWGDRQFRSDVSTERVNRYRSKHKSDRNGDDKQESQEPDRDNNDPVTTVKRFSNAPETELDTEKKPEANASGASKPIYSDSKHELWGEGVAILSQLGMPERSARSNIGRWLRDAKEDAQAVLGAIQRARDGRVIDPVPWITRALKPGAKQDVAESRSLVAAGRRAAERFRGTSSVGDPPGEPVLRVISQS